MVDVHNQARQFELALEKYWVTQSGYFRFITTMVGIVVTDAWRAYWHHLHKKHKHKLNEIENFANLLAKDMLDNTFKKTTAEEEVLYIPGNDEMNLDKDHTFQEISTVGPVAIGQPILKSSGETILNHGCVANNLETEMGNYGIPQTKRYRCVICRQKTIWHCILCHARVCDNFNLSKDCVELHVKAM